MSQFEHGRIRGYLRFLGFFAALLWTGLEYLRLRPSALEERSLWRQRMCLLIVRVIGLEIRVTGTVPETGMIVSNHLSYLDAVVLGALVPAVFVAKSEVRTWPLLGWLTANGGTIYLDRESVRAAAEVNRQLKAAIGQGLPVVIFPEGTTTGATDPLPFHPALFEPAAKTGAAVWPTALAYTVNGRSDPVPQHVCYWGDMTLVPHISGFMRLRRVCAHVRFWEAPVLAASRAEAAAMSHDAVRAMLHDGVGEDLRAAANRSVAPVQQTTLA